LLDIPENWSDPGDFTRIRILVPGEKDFVRINEAGWVKYRSVEASISPKISKLKNLVQSDFVLAVDASQQGRTLLLLFGYSYASSPGSLDLVELASGGPPRIVLHKDELGIIEMKDLDSDGVTELVGYPCMSQEFGNGLETYDPFNVYKLGPTYGEEARLSIQLSRNYNIEHYYGWAGATCSEKLAVVLHPPGSKKPRIMNIQEAERLTEDQPHK
jgi:hypothetical protein